MQTVADLRTESTSKAFFHYLKLSIAGMLVKSSFIIIDSIFIGRGIGAPGIGALSLTQPLFVFLAATAMMIGLGGATTTAVLFGRGDRGSGQTVFTQSLILVSGVAVVVVAVGMTWTRQIVALLGAGDELTDLSVTYLKFMLPFFLVKTPSWVMDCFIRNDSNPEIITLGMTVEAATNILLDYLFIIRFHWGIRGAALATGISQVVCLSIIMTHFSGKKGILRLNLRGAGTSKMGKILSTGFPNFVIEFTSALTIALFNLTLATRYSEQYVTAYGIALRLGSMVMFLLIAVNQAAQPLISYNHGAGKDRRIRKTLFLGTGSSLVLSLLALVSALFGAEQLVSLMTGNTEALPLAALTVRFYFAALPFLGWDLLMSTYFQAIEHPAEATFLYLLRGAALVGLGILGLPFLFPEKGILAGELAASALTALVSAVWLLRDRRRRSIDR